MKNGKGDEPQVTDASGDKDSPSKSQHSDESWGDKAIILLRDLICLHRLLKEESSDETGHSSGDEKDLSKRLFNILDKGHDYVFPDAVNKPKTFLKGQDIFLDEARNASASSQNSSVYKHSVDFVSSVVRDFGTQGTEARNDEKRAGDSGKGDGEKESQKVAADEKNDGKQAESSEKVTPFSHDILLLRSGDNETKLSIKGGYSGNERILSLVDQYVSTNNEKDRLSTLSSEKRAQAALAILDLAKESEGFRRGDATTNAPARFLVAPAAESKEDWLELNRMESAETTLILLFEKFLERERAPWGIQKSSSSARDGATSPAEDFSKPGTVPIVTPASHDVLFGRGGLTNNHPGNRRFRDIISLHRPDYVLAIKIEKPNVARRIVKAIRAGSPPGRFLKKNPKDEMWYDVGDRHAAEKTSQALREKVRKNHQMRSPGADVSRKRELNQGEAMARLAQSIAKRTRMNEVNGGSGDNSLSSPLQLGPMMQPFAAGMPVPQFGPYSMAIRMSDSQNVTPNANQGKQHATTPTSPNDGTDKGSNTKSGPLPNEGNVAESDKKIDDKLGDLASASSTAVEGEQKEMPNPVDEHGNIVVTDHDILCGRGGLTNHHRGNKRFRDIVSLHRADYFRAPKVLKPNVARLIVRAIRNGDPPGRFLKKDEKSGLWYDIGDKRAAEKASQALREKPNAEKQARDASGTSLIAPRPPQAPIYTMNPSALAMYPAMGASMNVATQSNGSDKQADESPAKVSQAEESPVKASGEKSESSKTDAKESKSEVPKSDLPTVEV